MQKALVTGAAGFIGSNVVKLLLEDGVEVRAMVLPGEDQRNLRGVEVETVQGDVMDPESLDKALVGCDTLFHLAAVYSIHAPRKLFFDVNVQGSRNMLWAAKKADLEKIVYTASIAALGLREGKLGADEETPFNQFQRCNDYVLTKYLSQQEALAFAKEEGMPIVVVNPCFPYGEGDVGPTPTGKIILDVANRVLFMAYEGGYNIIDVKDVAMGHLLAAKKGRIGEKYILGNMNVTLKELFEMVTRTAGIKTRIFKMPMALTLIYGYLWEKLADVTGTQPTVTHREAAYSHQYLFYDVSKAQRELGLELTPIETSLERSLEWFEREGYIPRTGPLVTVMSALQKLTSLGM